MISLRLVSVAALTVAGAGICHCVAARRYAQRYQAGKEDPYLDRSHQLSLRPDRRKIAAFGFRRRYRQASRPGPGRGIRDHPDHRIFSHSAVAERQGRSRHLLAVDHPRPRQGDRFLGALCGSSFRGGGAEEYRREEPAGSRRQESRRDPRNDAGHRSHPARQEHADRQIRGRRHAWRLRWRRGRRTCSRPAAPRSSPSTTGIRPANSSRRSRCRRSCLRSACARATPELLAWVNDWVKANLRNGKLNAINKTYHGVDLSPDIVKMGSN